MTNTRVTPAEQPPSRVEVVTRRIERADRPSVPPWWQPLFAACSTSSIFLSPSWLQTWLEIYGGEFEKSWVHWESNDGVVGGCLLLSRRIRVRSLPLRTLFLNASGQAK